MPPMKPTDERGLLVADLAQQLAAGDAHEEVSHENHRHAKHLQHVRVLDGLLLLPDVRKGLAEVGDERDHAAKEHHRDDGHPVDGGFCFSAL